MLWAICIACISCETQTVKEEDAKEIHDTIKKDFSFVTKTDSIVENGEQIYYHKSGAVEMRGNMKDGKRDGLWKSFYENGLPWSETTFKEGKKEGKTTTWYENGKKRYEGSFKNDVESGRWVFWNEDGTLVDTKNYDLR